MLRHILLIAAWVLLPLHVAAQDFVRFGAYWTMTEIYPTVGPGDGGRAWTYFLRGDTTVAGQQYGKLYFQAHCTWRPDRSNGGELRYSYNDTTAQLVGGLRESGLQVLLRPLGEPVSGTEFYSAIGSREEFVIYDFGLTVGDTLWTTDSRYTVITDTLTGEDGAREFEVHHSTHFDSPRGWNAVRTDRGSTAGLFGGFYASLTYLDCHGDDYVSGGDIACHTCPARATSSAPGTVASEVRVIADRASGWLRVDGAVAAAGWRGVLSDVSGREVARFRLDDRGTAEVQLREVPAGVLVLQLTGGDTRLSKLTSW